jgi:arylsulfatase A
LQDAGYATCYTGKWQLDGGDIAIRKFGFQRYSVWQPYNINAEDEGNRYKGCNHLPGWEITYPRNVTSNKYSEDEFTAYTLNFIDSVTAIKKPFFAFYSLINCHSPFQPTPDDPDYATWDTLRNEPKYFPSMVKYHDKKIGEIIHHLDSAGLLENTMIFYFGDNGTNTLIRSQFQGYTVKGGKGNTDEPGTNVPLIVYQRGKIPAQTTSDALIDFSDFFPTFQKIAGIRTLSADYGIMDGVSFAPAILSDIDTIRTSIYDSYSTHPDRHSFIKWAQNYEYKLYDKDAGTQANQFIKLGKCMPDGTPIPDSLMTPEQIQVKRNLQKVLKKYDAQMN